MAYKDVIQINLDLAAENAVNRIAIEVLKVLQLKVANYMDGAQAHRTTGIHIQRTIENEIALYQRKVV